MPSESSWRRIAAKNYGLREPLLLQERRHFSRHYFIANGSASYVLSRVTKATDRLPFGLQFKIMALLRRGGVTTVNMPVLTRGGKPYVDDGTDYWFLRRFRASDSVIWRVTPDLVKAAASALVPVHVAGSDAQRMVALGGVDHTRLAPYYLPVEAFFEALGRNFPQDVISGLSATDRSLLGRTVAELRESRQKMLTESREQNLVGITHHDFRPDNLLVRDRKVVEIIDWDCASIDHQLYDVAFAALQYGQRQCLHDADIGLAKVFIDRYLTERGREHLHPELMRWFLRFTVVKRLLIKGRNNERIRLLRALENGPISCQPDGVAAQ